MSNFIVLTSKCYENARANGICGRQIHDALIKKGHKSFLVGYTPVKMKNDVVDGDCYKFYYSGSKKNGRLESIKRIFVPRYSRELVDKYVDICDDIIQNNKIDCIVGIYFPIETILALTILKKKYSGIKMISYQVDSATDVAMYDGIMHKLHTQAYVNKGRSIYRQIDYVIAMNSNKFNMLKRYSTVLKDKLIFVNSLALYEKHSFVRPRNKDTVDFLYTGTLDKDFYSPKPFIEMFSINPEYSEWRLHFYSRGNCENELKEAAEKDSRIILHGYVNQDELNNAMMDADFFLSTDHIVKKNCVPYKILSYFSYGKPVIHFTKEAGYTVENYIDKYPLGLTVKQDYLKEENKKAVDFIINNVGNFCNVDEIYKLFYKDTAEYSAELIENL